MREEGESQWGGGVGDGRQAADELEQDPSWLLLPPPLLPLLLMSCECLRQRSSLAETNTSASNGSTMFSMMDDNTLPPPLAGVSHKLLVSPTRQSAILVLGGDVEGGTGGAGRNTLNLGEEAMMAGEEGSDGSGDSACSCMMMVAAAVGEDKGREQREELKMKGGGWWTCQRGGWGGM